MKKTEIPCCPYCENKDNNKRYGNRYKCGYCESLFDEEDIIREDLRHKISAILMDTDEDHQKACDIIIGENDACGLSSLELPRVTSCYQMPGEGTIWFHIDGYVNPETKEWEYMNFDDIDTIDLKFILAELQQ